MILNRLHKNRNMRGFTLLELLIAITLLAIGLLAAAAMQGVAIRANSYANRFSVASMLGQQVVEDLSSLMAADPLLHAIASNVTYNRMSDPATNGSQVGTLSMTGAGRFSAQYDIAPNTPLAGTTQITVRVFYDGTTTPLITFITYKRVT